MGRVICLLGLHGDNAISLLFLPPTLTLEGLGRSTGKEWRCPGESTMTPSHSYPTWVWWRWGAWMEGFELNLKWKDSNTQD